MLKRWFLLLLMFGLMAPVIGCEGDAEVDDDGASLKVDVDD